MFMNNFFFHRPIVFLHGSAKVLIKKKMVAPLTVGTLLQLISARIHSQSLRQFIVRGFEYAVAFHGFSDEEHPKSICIGGITNDKKLKEDIKMEIESEDAGDRSIHVITSAQEILMVIM